MAVEILLVLAVLVGAHGAFAGAKSKFDSDGAQWIGSSRYFLTLFVERDVSPAAWPDEYWTRTHPMVHRYALGAQLWRLGHDLRAVDPDYDVWLSHAENRRLGRVPSDRALADARVLMQAFAAVAVALLYLVVRVLVGGVGGVLGGLAAAGLAANSPYLQEHLVRAKAEATLMALLMASLLVAVVGLRRPRSARGQIGWGALAGMPLGLAFATKLTAVLVLAAVVLWGALAVLAAVAMRRTPSPWRWPAAALGVALLVFVLSNPFLYPDPVGRTLLLFENRQTEMADQRRNEPGRAVNGLRDRFALVWERSLFNDATGPSRLGRPVELVLGVLGLGMLAVLAARRRPGAEAFVLLWALCLWIGVSAGLGFRLQHYFVPTAIIGTLLSGLAIGRTIEGAVYLARVRLRRPSPSPALATSAPIAVQ